MKNKILFEFNKDISQIMECIEDGEEIKARHIFNTKCYERYKPYFGEATSLLYFALELWEVLNAYLNNEAARTLDELSTNKAYLLSVYHDYQKDYKKQ